MSPQEAKAWGVPRPLKPKTMERIARGIRKFVLESGNPFIIKFRLGATGQPIWEPMHTITAGSYIKRPAGAGHAMGLVVPVIDNITHGGRTEPMDEPLRTITTAHRGEKAVIAASLVNYHSAKGDETRGQTMKEPLRTQDTSNRFGLATAFLTKFFGTTTGSGVQQPVPTVTGGGQHIGEVRAFLMKYYKPAVGQDLCEPLHTATNKARFGLVTVEGEDYQIADIGLRMLTPRELARAQGFPDEYILTGSKSNQVAKIGNSVCPPIAAALVRANVQLAQIPQRIEATA
jgi:DNA (cytosine-5)-methyltransferase 1